MSQKVRIDGVKHVGASVFLGVDHCNNPYWTRNPERIMVWLYDGWRTRFNQRTPGARDSSPTCGRTGRFHAPASRWPRTRIRSKADGIFRSGIRTA